jgi:(2Fe-2S) ferredoxin
MPADPALYYDHHIFCCTNTRPPGHPRGCCSAKGSEPLRNYMKVRAKELGLAKTRINAAGCLDRCELGPTLVIYPEGVWYSYRSTEDLDEILETHLIKGGRVERLMLQPDQVPPKGA